MAETPRLDGALPRRHAGRAAWGTLSREEIIRAAHRVVSAGGYEDMSIRSLAGDLGVAPMSLYRHIRDKDDLLDEVVDRLLARAWAPGSAYGALHTYTIGFAALEASRASWTPEANDTSDLAKRLADYTSTGQFTEGDRAKGPDLRASGDLGSEIVAAGAGDVGRIRLAGANSLQ